MNLSYFISKRISQEQREGFSSTIHKIAIASIAVGLAATIIAFLIMEGFQETIQNKIYAFTGHLIITKFTMNNSPEEVPVNYKIDPYLNPQKYPLIEHLQEYAHKAGLIKTQDEVFGVVLKGVGKSFDQKAFSGSLIEGKFLDFPDSTYANQVVLSKIISKKVGAKVGDNIIVHFFQNPPRFRKLKVVGIYETNMSEYFDGKVIITDLRLIQKLNDWNDSIAGGLEVFVKDPSRIDDAGYQLGEPMDYDLDIERVSDRYYNLFDWLRLLSRQVNILLVIILIVVCVNMISIVLILVMERTQMIGMLKAMGGKNRLIRSVFIYQGINLITKGLLYGNVLALSLCFLQDRFKFIKLNPHDYYMNAVPISWHWEIVLLLNLLMFVVVTVVLLIPTMVISRINPIRAIRFD
ncbi:MAG TPA: ABC transporter permease [Cyclobacteriaceae bacterium]|nr:ABC transporter permease [Cyclobacteriaceae bacterium]